MNTNNIVLARKINFFGIVQGVGFRPHIYKLAQKNKLLGSVSNSISGVEVIIEGSEDAINQFIKDVSNKNPPISRVDKFVSEIIKPVGFDSFSILESKISGNTTTTISPDVSVCVDCLNEINNPENRRYRYPFTNCTNCGPRYSIINEIPYDRDKTSMNKFKMCSLCQSEYDDPENRRFHAQPNACATCGPELWLTDSKGRIINSKDPILKASNFIKKGLIVAIKSLGGFHLIVDATNQLAVGRLRFKKKRQDKPLALMSSNIDTIKHYAHVRSNEKSELESIQRPIVLLRKKKNPFISKEISPNNKYIGVMLPYTPIHYLILSEGFLAVVMTSGNLSGEPIIINNKDAIKKLGNIADFFIMHNRDIITRSDDSILNHCSGKTRIIRRSRGYAPLHIDLANSYPSVLACGAEKKNTICIIRKNKAFMSQYLGNINVASAYNFFQDTIKHMQKILRTSSEIIACDYHPDYMSTRYATNQTNNKIIKVQHHHAHIVSCMAENHISSPVIGLAFDGTGMGSDGTIWGGEVLISEYDSFDRVNYLEPTHMPGGTVAVKEPWRMGISYLYKTFGESFINLDIPFLNSLRENDIKIITTMIREKINTPYTSSLGRFFDAVAAIINLRKFITFEGQASIELEMIAADHVTSLYNFEGPFKQSLITSIIINEIIKDIKNCVPVSIISAKFHNTIIAMFTKVCTILRKKHNIRHVALSGGVFQNVLLMSGIKNNLEKHGFDVITHHLTPFNDGGISLGQAIIASHLA